MIRCKLLGEKKLTDAHKQDLKKYVGLLMAKSAQNFNAITFKIACQVYHILSQIIPNKAIY